MVLKSKQKDKKLGGFQKKVLNLLAINNTSKFVIKQTGKSRQYVNNTIDKLISKNYLKRKKRGVYEVCLQVAGDTAQFSDFLRLHNLEIELRVNSDIHSQIRNQVLKKKTFDNIRSSGNNGGHYFDFGNVTYMITQSKLFVFFPKDWEVIGEDLKEIAIGMYDAIEKEINKFEKRFHYYFFSDDRVNFNIRNVHIASVKNGITEEFKKNNINHLCITDEQDGKPRFILDFSKGLAELEAVHPDHAFLDADRVKSFLGTLKTGEYDTIVEDHKNFFNLPEPTSASEILNLVKHLTEECTKASKNSNTFMDVLAKSFLLQTKNHSDQIKNIMLIQQSSQNQINTIATSLNAILQLLGATQNKIQPDKDVKEEPDNSYFG